MELDIITIGWLGVLAFFTISISLVVWGRGGM
ncbi:MAG: cytochrome b6-f complex subunit PetN [Thermostichales cyanobacterium BF4_bins_65]